MAGGQCYFFCIISPVYRQPSAIHLKTLSQGVYTPYFRFMKQSENIEVMKTTTQSLSVSAAIYTTLFLLIASMAFGSERKLDNNGGDAPPVFVFEEEEYIDDIPFDTKAVVEAYMLNETMNVVFDFEEEAYIDDIPYNTYEIARNHKMEEYLKNVFVFEEEEYIDDIPFDTEEVFNEVFFKDYYARIKAKQESK
jgi:hypothetical protein